MNKKLKMGKCCGLWTGVRGGLWVGLALLAGCASTASKPVDVVEAPQPQQFEGKSTTQALEETETALKNIQQAKPTFYSPESLTAAQDALADARFLILAPKEKAVDGVSPDAETFTKISQAKDNVTQAETSKLEVQKRLADILKVRESLVAKGIHQSSAAEFKELTSALLELFQRIEKNNLEGFESAKIVTLSQFRQLEAQYADEVQIDQVIAVLEKAKANGAAVSAPQSYKITQQALKNAQDVIKRNPDDQAVIKNAVVRFSFEANHLAHVTEKVNELRVLDPAAMENILLAAEQRLLAISDALKQPDSRQQNLQEQTRLIATAVDKLVSEKAIESAKPRTRHFTKNELDSARDRIDQLQVQLQDVQLQSVQSKGEKKTLSKRIDALERLVIKLNNKNSGLEVELAKLEEEKAPPIKGVEIMPIKK